MWPGFLESPQLNPLQLLVHTYMSYNFVYFVVYFVVLFVCCCITYNYADFSGDNMEMCFRVLDSYSYLCASSPDQFVQVCHTCFPVLPCCLLVLFVYLLLFTELCRGGDTFMSELHQRGEVGAGDNHHEDTGARGAVLSLPFPLPPPANSSQRSH